MIKVSSKSESKSEPKFPVKFIFIAALIGAITGSTVTYGIIHSQKPSVSSLIKSFYDTENAVHVSPHSLRKMMDKGDKSYILVDLRSPQEYEKEHIIGSINIPAYKDPDTSAYDEKDRILSEFREIPINREIIVYCYSTACMTGRKIGQLLAEYGIYVKHLGIGWNEWRYDWKMWNHDGEAPSKVEDYIFSGKDAGEPKIRTAPSPCGEGNLSC